VCGPLLIKFAIATCGERRRVRDRAAGVDHLPIASEETHVVLLEPKSTLNTGNVRNERTVSELDRI